MARAAPTGWSTSNYLMRSGFVKDGDALLMHAWSNFPSQADLCVMSQGQAGTLANHRELRLLGSGTRYRATVQAAGAATSINSGTGTTINTWIASSAIFMSSTSRYCAFNGTKGTENTTSVAPGTPNEILIGIRHDDSEPWSSTGAIASPSMWDLDSLLITDVDALLAELDTLVEGLARDPRLINLDSGAAHEGKLLAFWDLDVNSPTFGEDLTGNGHDLTMVGTLTAFASYPPVATTTVTSALTGTIIAEGQPMFESDIVTGGKTIILTLTNDQWVAAGATFDAQRQNIIDGLTAASSPAGGWNAEVKTDIAVTDVVRTSATVVTITLPAIAGYALTDTQEIITATIPASALEVSLDAIVASPTFTIHPVIATARRAPSGFDITGNFLLADDVFLDSDDFLVMGWGYHVSGKSTYFAVGKNGILSHHRRLFISTSEDWKVGSFWNPTGEPGDGGYDSGQDHEGGQANLAVDITPNRWHHIAGAYISTTDRRGWLHGANEATSTTLSTPNAPNEIALGVRCDRAEGLESDEAMAEWSIWDISSASIADIRALIALGAALVDGVAPTALELEELTTIPLVSYPDLDFNSPTFGQDLSGNGNHFTVQGTLTEFDSYPPVAEVDALTFVFDYNSRLQAYLWDFYASTGDLTSLARRYVDNESTGEHTARVRDLIQDATDAMT